MKYLRSYSILLICLAALVFFNFSCKKCKDTSETKALSTFSKSLIPYTDYTKLTFTISQISYTATFVSFPPVPEYSPFYEFNKPATAKNPDGCKTTFASESKDYLFQVPLYSKLMVCGIARYNNSEYLWVGYENDLFTSKVSGLSNPYEYDSLTIQNKTYYNVSYFKNDLNPNMENGCFYNKEFGILKLEMGDGYNMELLKKE